MQMSAIDYRHVSFALELIMLRPGILYTPDCEWSRVQMQMYVDCCWHTLALAFIIVYIYIFIFLSFTLCTLCTNFILDK